MSDLTGQEIKETYKDLLHMNNGNTGVTSDLSRVFDGEGTGSALYLSDTEASVMGKVGIGTTSPSHDLTLGSPTSAGSTDDRLKIYRGADDAGQNLEMGYRSITVTRDTNVLADPQSTFSIKQKGSDGERVVMQIDPSGKVGIGTTSPDEALHIKGDNKRMFIGSDDYNLFSLGRRSSTELDTAYLSMMDEGDQKVVLDTSGDSYFNGGNVGIGTTSPESELHIKGDITFSGGTTQNQGTRAEIVHTSGVDANGDESSNDGGLLFRSYDNSTAVDALAITHNGHVGIGTTSPSARLNIVDGQSSVASSATGQLVLQNSSTDGGKWGIHTSAGGWNIGGGGKLGFFADDNANQARMVITQAGEVGIGTTSPSAKLELNSGSTITTADQGLAGLKFQNGSSSISNSAFIDGRTDVTGATDYTDKVGLAIFTQGNEAMRITSAGKVGIGTPNPSADANLDVRGRDTTYVAQFISTYTDPGHPGYKGIKIQAGMANSGTAGNNKWIEFYNGNGSTIIGGIQNTSNTTVAFFSGSDRRIKKNINDTSIKGIDSIKALKLRSWDWNSTEPMTSVDIGLIADELEEVYPELVSRQKMKGWEHCIGEGEEDLKTIPTESKITLTLVKAIQEQQQIIEDLKSRIVALEGGSPEPDKAEEPAVEEASEEPVAEEAPVEESVSLGASISGESLTEVSNSRAEEL